jgi:glyoxylase-like metal-dependent hydrolase (beta-lactamase superfamily II)/rhodanese-related sulfurtransferase
MLFRELNRGKCKTYLVACEETGAAALVDPVREKLERYLAILAYFRLKLEAVIDTHTHADHRTASFDLRELVGATAVMHRRAPAPHIDRHVDDGDVLTIGKVDLRVLFTPGHAPDGISLHVGNRVLTGDTLLIRGTGRSDFAGGDPGAQYDAITGKLFRLPDDTKVFPAHDYRGNQSSTIGEEKRLNPRVAGRSREAYIELMNNLGLALPDKIQEVLQPNQTALDDDGMHFPTLAELNQVRQRSAAEADALLRSASPPLVLDVREPDEFDGELGHIAGAVLIPLKELSARACEVEAHKDRSILVVCRAGVRSATGAAILTGLGYEHVTNLKGGMVDWNDQKLTVERQSHDDG